MVYTMFVDFRIQFEKYFLVAFEIDLRKTKSILPKKKQKQTKSEKRKKIVIIETYKRENQKLKQLSS